MQASEVKGLVNHCSSPEPCTLPSDPLSLCVGFGRPWCDPSLESCLCFQLGKFKGLLVPDGPMVLP